MSQASLLSLLKSEAVSRGLLKPECEIDAAVAFTLVREMPYLRAPDRRPETIIHEWKGTCSGKHYLLKSLFAELGLPSRLMACTVIVPVDPHQVPKEVRELYEAANRRFVDVHNYLVICPVDGKEMIVDATWPLSARSKGMVSNEEFILGQDQQIASQPVESWPVPEDRDPQEFKDELLRTHFSPAELEFRDLVIRWLGEETSR